MRTFKHLTYTDRLRIETWLRTGTSYKTIAEELGVHVSTIYREVKRGLYDHRDYEYRIVKKYSPEIAEQKYQEHLKAKGADLKIGNDQAYADFLEKKMVDERYSPEAALGEAKKQGYKTSVSKSTLYSYIDKGVFLRVTRKSLPVKKDAKKKHSVRPKRLMKGDSIEKRPDVVDEVSRMGDWEMDCVIGTKKAGTTLLAMTERKTLGERLVLMPRKTAANVVKALDDMERRLGYEAFAELFRTITVDNGMEFADANGIERSATRPGEKRTKLYYCHPYSSYERGRNENQNKLVRRWYPKGMSFKDITQEEIQALEDWINTYPRKKFGYKSSRDMAKQYLEGMV